jgi:hypothetical protein
VIEIVHAHCAAPAQVALAWQLHKPAITAPIIGATTIQHINDAIAATQLPGYTISLKNAQGKKVKSLRRGKYTFIIRDKANIHNFTLKGPGVRNKVITGTGFVGTKTVRLTLKKGTYRFYCTVHPLVSGTFKVT